MKGHFCSVSKRSMGTFFNMQMTRYAIFEAEMCYDLSESQVFKLIFLKHSSLYKNGDVCISNNSDINVERNENCIISNSCRFYVFFFQPLLLVKLSYYVPVTTYISSVSLCSKLFVFFLLLELNFISFSLFRVQCRNVHENLF